MNASSVWDERESRSLNPFCCIIEITTLIMPTKQSHALLHLVQRWNYIVIYRTNIRTKNFPFSLRTKLPSRGLHGSRMTGQWKKTYFWAIGEFTHRPSAHFSRSGMPPKPLLSRIRHSHHERTSDLDTETQRMISRLYIRYFLASFIEVKLTDLATHQRSPFVSNELEQDMFQVN